MPCEIENGIVKRYLPCVEEQEVETADGFVHMRVTEIGVKVPEGVRRIGAYAFCDCRVLQRVLLPEGVEEISPYAFYGCFGLREITLPSTVKRIGKNAFAECANLRSVILPRDLQEIGFSAFAGCYRLSEVQGDFYDRMAPEKRRLVFERCPVIRAGEKK